MLTSAKGNTWPFGHKLVFSRKAIQHFLNWSWVPLITTVYELWVSIPRGNAATDTYNGNTQACTQRVIVPFKSENTEVAELLVEVRTEMRAARDRQRAESSSDYSIPPRSRWVLWQNVLDINMLLRCNKTSLRTATLDANFIRGPMQERHLSMQMRELSLSKLRRMPAKCTIVDVGFCAVTTIQMWKAFSSRILQWHRRRTLAFEVVWVSWNSHCSMVWTYRSYNIINSTIIQTLNSIDTKLQNMIICS